MAAPCGLSSRPTLMSASPRCRMSPGSRVLRASMISPCRWSTCVEPARSWRSSTFCVTIRTSNARSRSTSARCAAWPCSFGRGSLDHDRRRARNRRRRLPLLRRHGAGGFDHEPRRQALRLGLRPVFGAALHRGSLARAHAVRAPHHAQAAYSGRLTGSSACGRGGKLSRPTSSIRPSKCSTSAEQCSIQSPQLW